MVLSTHARKRKDWLGIMINSELLKRGESICALRGKITQWRITMTSSKKIPALKILRTGRVDLTAAHHKDEDRQPTGASHPEEDHQTLIVHENNQDGNKIFQGDRPRRRRMKDQGRRRRRQRGQSDGNIFGDRIRLGGPSDRQSFKNKIRLRTLIYPSDNGYLK